MKVRKLKMFVAAVGLGLGLLPLSAPANAVVCIEDHPSPTACCEGITVAGKTIDPIPMDC